jgi:tetratricopeptide (TPR) repeat protein
VAAEPANSNARESLVDALRATGQARVAWATAQPLLAEPSLSTERRLALAELALEADAASAVHALVSPVTGDATHGETARALVGRALLADGRPRDAATLLLTLDRTRFSPPSALALVDSIAAVDGAERAWTMASAFTADSIDWSDFLGRRTVLAALTGHADQAAADRVRLAQLDPIALILADAELALARERPHDALAALASLPAHRVTERTEDLRATALIGTGDIPAARAVVRAQHAARPDFLPYTIRDAELTWREQPNAVTLAALLDLAARHDRFPQAVVAGARALLAEARHAEALALLGVPDTWRDLPLDGRLVAARSLRAIGRAAEALELFDDRTPATGAAAILRAELIATVHGADAARREFSLLADAPGSSGDVFLAWAAVLPAPIDRAAVLDEGLRRFPNRADIALALASARGAAGDMNGRVAAAELAVGLEPRSADAWFQLVDATAAGRTRTAAADVLDRFMAATGDAPTLIIALADRLASLVHVGQDPLTARLLSWLTPSHVPDAYALSRDTTRVRLLAAAERWPEATAAVDALVASGHAPPAVLRLRADVLSWAGRHDAALSAYDVYLSTAPDDHAARRQQARVAGWAGRAEAARAYYEAVIRAQPDAPGPAAEMRAKIAFIEGRWREAIRAYEHWLTLEPDNSEARFEYAESLRGAGETARANEVLANLAADTGHRLAAAARDRRQLLRQPAAEFAISDRAANGYAGQRLLRLRDQGVTFAMTPGPNPRTTLRAEGVAVQAMASGATRSGYRMGAAAERAITTVLTTGVSLALWDLARTGAPVWHLGASTAWRASDRWTLGGRFDREPLLETMATIDARMTATGVGGTAAFESPRASATIEIGWHHLSDGNSRTRLSGSTTRTAHERLRHVRLIGWGEWIGYGREAATYFSPAGFLRLDGGAEYTFQLGHPRFRDDRGDEVAVGFLLGADNRGTIYRHPSIRASWEFSPGLRIDARGSLIRSRTYNDASVFVSLRVMGAGF